MKKSDLRKIIREEIYSTSLANRLVDKKIVNSKMTDAELFIIIAKHIKHDMTASSARWNLDHGEFVDDTIKNIRNRLK